MLVEAIPYTGLPVGYGWHLFDPIAESSAAESQQYAGNLSMSAVTKILQNEKQEKIGTPIDCQHTISGQPFFHLF